MQVLSVTNMPIYLPYDSAPIPFGDPYSDVTATAAAPGIFTVPGYNAPVAGDAVCFSFQAGGSLPAPLTVIGGTVTNAGLNSATIYYVVAPIVNNTFAVSATKGGAAITTTTTGSLFTIHLLSGQVDGAPIPFEVGYSAVCMNLTAGSLVLQGAPDLNDLPAAYAGGQYGNPKGPGTYVTLATVPAGSAQVVQLSQSWIRVSTAATLVLLQN
jgi:hypothetical protein